MSDLEARIKELEAELGRVRELMYQMGRLVEIGKLTAVVAHELSQPLLGIKAFAQILHGKCADDEFVAPKVQIIIQQAGVMETILDNLRQFGRTGVVKPGPVDLAEVVHTSLELFGERARKANLVLEAHVQEGLPLVRGNRGHVQQVVVNLIANAIDEIEPGKNGRVEARLLSADGRVLLRVADTGSGVPDLVRPRLFEPFYTTKGDKKGTGLGLSICKEILQAQGGEIRLMESAEVERELGSGYGAVFEVGLRAADTQSDPDRPEGGSSGE